MVSEYIHASFDEKNIRWTQKYVLIANRELNGEISIYNWYTGRPEYNIKSVVKSDNTKHVKLEIRQAIEEVEKIAFLSQYNSNKFVQLLPDYL